MLPPWEMSGAVATKLVITGGATTLTVMVKLVLRPTGVSTRLTVKVYAPTVVTVPVMLPLERVRPGGRVPLPVCSE